MRYRDDETDLDEPDEPDDDDTGDTRTCPECRAAIYEDAECCPHCGTYLTDDEGIAARPWWFVAGALLCLAVALSWVLG